jgi:tRNA A37 methylthiotransferase MiaB
MEQRWIWDGKLWIKDGCGCTYDCTYCCIWNQRGKLK